MFVLVTDVLDTFGRCVFSRLRSAAVEEQARMGSSRDGALPDDGTPVRLRALTRSGRVVWSADVAVAGGQVQVDTPRVRDAVTLRVELAGSEVSLPWP